ncbi:MAG TPA: class II aldolase/adducin family protein [Methanomassiliicoccales archaeon]|jgi:L-fuculose-phosphate aldolase
MIEEARREIVEYGKLLYQKGLTVGTAGNISLRGEGRTMLITPTSTCKGMLDPDRLVLIDLDEGKVLSGGRPSIETPFHLALYRTRPEVNAVIHTHPAYCTALAVKGIKVQPGLTPEGLLVLGRDVPMVPYATPGTADLAKALSEAPSAAMAFLLEKHGAIAVGKDMSEAFHRMETLEFMAHLQCNVRSLGGAEQLSPAEVDRILKR